MVYLIRCGAQAPTDCHAFVLWFDACFTARFGAAEETILSTSPLQPQTHWHQAIIMLRCAVLLRPYPFRLTATLHPLDTSAALDVHRKHVDCSHKCL